MKAGGRETRAAVEKNGAAEDPAAWKNGTDGGMASAGGY